MPSGRRSFKVFDHIWANSTGRPQPDRGIGALLTARRGVPSCGRERRSQLAHMLGRVQRREADSLDDSPDEHRSRGELEASGRNLRRLRVAAADLAEL